MRNRLPFVLFFLSLALVCALCKKNALPSPSSTGPDERNEREAPACRFAFSYTKEDILKDPSRFIDDLLGGESAFLKFAVENETGLSYDGSQIDMNTGELVASGLHFWSAASKESLHISIFAQFLKGNARAQRVVPFSKEEVLELLGKKITTYEEFFHRFPGYGGFLPWYFIKNGTVVPANGWENQTPSLDNGQLAWALYALKRVLLAIGEKDLAQRYGMQWDLMRHTAMALFWNETMHSIRPVAGIKDTSKSPLEPGNVFQPVCGGPPCWLDDFYEGDLFAHFLQLHADPRPSDLDFQAMWQGKMKKLESVDYVIPSSPDKKITVMRGWWFSSHETWPILLMPFNDCTLHRRIYNNMERCRTWNSREKEIPGLYASVTDLSSTPGYISATGIQEVAFQKVLRTDVVTPYATFPTLMANETVGALWLWNMLRGDRMQGPMGTTEGVSIHGNDISNVVTWDSKMTTVTALLGGIISHYIESLAMSY
eukprot:TRINITY_DN1217_c0_g1_i3.p1 TRINITY_DN1217_c0_g1~~TRINITY_DN1217_c0_g1_i3.p1  ORF type:complete len:485 (+),score=127.43 TRINITY_DN1217_c0_g1_i3:97-1551(+)